MRERARARVSGRALWACHVSSHASTDGAGGTLLPSSIPRRSYICRPPDTQAGIATVDEGAPAERAPLARGEGAPLVPITALDGLAGLVD